MTGSGADYAGRLGAWARRAGVRVENVRYPRPEARGEVMAVRLTPVRTAARAVVVHGAGNDAIFPLLALFRTLLAADTEVFSFDVDGHGRGSTTVFAADSVRRAVAAAVRVARDGRPALPLHLVGHSLGGALVLDALAVGSVECASASILSAPVEVRIGVRTVLGELGGFFRIATLGQRADYGLWGLVPAFGPVRRGAYPFRRADADGRSWSYVAAVGRLLAEMELERRVESIRTPTLLVYSRGDALVPHAQGERLAARIRAARLVSLRSASHYSLPFDDGTLASVAEWTAAPVVATR
ncbi:MAG TPA: alpha/beta fold hydrolase [Longimicrobium sp.]|uniref:alpha/beta fold hydrolase n=1 Tax=Longimicrobium sp. TaxID=2029185 RepID=UPI002EDB8805